MTAAAPATVGRNGLLAIFGGSGLYELPGLSDTAWMTLSTPWGEPSDQILTGTQAELQPRCRGGLLEGHP